MIDRGLVVAVALSASLLAGCDTSSGIRRQVSIEGPVDWNCVQVAVLTAHPGAQIRRDQEGDSDPSVSLYWGPYFGPDTSPEFALTTRPSVTIRSTRNDRPTTILWDQHFAAVNQYVERTLIAELRVAMLATEREVSALCGLNFSGTREFVN